MKLDSSRFLLCWLGLLSSTEAGRPHPPCKAVPGSADWPCPDDWNHLNESLGGRLLQPAPPGAVCHPGQRTYDAGQCPAVTAGWTVYELHTSDPVSVLYNQFSNDSCLPDPSYPCSAAGYPAFVINATTPEHVKLGVDFARERNVRLVVKGTGHDYLGRSIAPNSLSIWTHNMKGLKFHSGQFQPDGCDFAIEGNAVTAEAGAQMFDLYAFADGFNETVVGGGGKTVGIGGYITGGGHSLLAPRYGMAADQVLELELVTPEGEVVRANECRNQDLFWAIRGGGGSTFGVITSVTMKTYPTPKIVNMDLFCVVGKDEPKSVDIQTFWLSKMPYLESRGLSGYGFVFGEMPNPTPVGPGFISGFFSRLALQGSIDENDMMSIIQPLGEELMARYPDSGILFQPNVTKYKSFLEWFEVNYDQGSAGVDSYLASRLLDADSLTIDEPALRDVVAGLIRDFGGFSTHLVSGRGVRDAKPRGGGDAVLEAWRKTIVHLITAKDFPPHNATAKAEAISFLNEHMQPLRDFAPDTGSYINEAFTYEPDWQHTFWGSNYDRLVSIKRAVDPRDVLWCHPCVGNEGWKEVGDKLCKV